MRAGRSFGAGAAASAPQSPNSGYREVRRAAFLSGPSSRVPRKLCRNRMRMQRLAITPLASVRLGSSFERIRNRTPSVPCQCSLCLRGTAIASSPLIDSSRSTSSCDCPASLASETIAARLSISGCNPKWPRRYRDTPGGICPWPACHAPPFCSCCLRAHPLTTIVSPRAAIRVDDPE
jgi:hypothetical protein